MTQFWNIYYQKTSKALFFLFFADSRQMLICFHNFSDQTFIKKSRIMFPQMFR